MSTRKRVRERAGWVLFTLCALVYIVANIQSRDWLSLLGSIFFLLACFLFILSS